MNPRLFPASRTAQPSTEYGTHTELKHVGRHTCAPVFSSPQPQPPPLLRFFARPLPHRPPLQPPPRDLASSTQPRRTRNYYAPATVPPQLQLQLQLQPTPVNDPRYVGRPHAWRQGPRQTRPVVLCSRLAGGATPTMPRASPLKPAFPAAACRPGMRFSYPRIQRRWSGLVSVTPVPRAAADASEGKGREGKGERGGGGSKNHRLASCRWIKLCTRQKMSVAKQPGRD